MLTGWKLKLSKWFLIPQRYVLGIMGFFAIVNAYNMRVCLSVAITVMTVPLNSSSIDSQDSCPSYDTTTNTTHHPIGNYNWDNSVQGLILGSFFWGYIITHIPGGLLAEKFGGKHSLGIGILSTAIFTMLTPVVVKYGDWQWLVVLRILEGLGEGTTYPAINVLLAQWVPLNERAKIGTLVYAGSQVGTMVGNAVSGTLIASTNSWESVFYLFGGLGILWFIIWCLICFSSPDTHPFISDEEKKFLANEIGLKQTNEKLCIPWKAMMTSVPLWALIAAQIGHDWGFFAMVTDLPKYMSEILKYKIDENGLLSSAPYLVMWTVSMISGWLCDWLIDRSFMSVSFARKFFTTIASVGPAVFIVAASYAGCERNVVIVLFCIGMGLMGTFYPGMKVNALDLAPNYAGTLMAIVNGIGAITGIIVPILIGYLTKHNTLSEWRLVFWICFGVFMVTNLIYVVCGSADEQAWNKKDSDKCDGVECQEKESSVKAEKANVDGIM